MSLMREDQEFRGIFIEGLKEIADNADLYLLNKYRANLSNNWGVEISGKETMGVVYAQLINNRINQFPPRVRNLLLIMPVAALFGILQIAFIVLGYIYSFFSWLVLIILYKTKFYHYKIIEVKKQEIEI